MGVFIICVIVLMIIYYVGSDVSVRSVQSVQNTVGKVSPLQSSSVGTCAQRFYTTAEIFPKLENIPRDAVGREVNNIIVKSAGDNWIDWPEKNLWDAGPTGARWTVFPLIAFGRRITKNCSRMPSVMRFIDEIDQQYGVKIALLSRLGPGMKLVPHQGWGDHSNGVLRCHYGVKVPAAGYDKYGRIRECCIEVADEACTHCAEGARIRCEYFGQLATGKESLDVKCDKCYNGFVYESRQHRTGEWIIFDDSKLHLAENNTAEDRIVLILDIVRPDWVPMGTSTVEDTTELQSIINEYEKM